MPIIEKSSILNDLHFVVWHITEREVELWQNLHLPKGDSAKIQGFTNINRRREMLATRQCLRAFFGNNMPAITYLSNGCPLLSNGYHLSVSHTRELAAIALCKNGPVGIDIEIRRDRIARIARKFVNEREEQFLTEEQRMDYLLALWGAKESVVKLSRNRRLDFKQAIEVQPFEINGKECRAEVWYRNPEEHRAQLYFQINDNYILTLAYQ